MRFDCLERHLAAAYGKYARIVCRWPTPFILLPVLVTSVLFLGLARRPPLLKDDLSLYTPSDARAKRELTDLENHFLINDTDPFYYERRYELKRFGYLIVTSKMQDSNVLTPEIFKAVNNLWDEIQAINVSVGTTHYNYSRLCVIARIGGKITNCFQNPIVGSWTRSRPWLGIGGVLSAAMAIVSSIGVLLLAGHRFTSVAYSMPFIVFSIGVDNVFILLAAWRKTPIFMKLSDRMSLTFQDAGVSITVTSLTDGLSFGVGCTTSFPSVRVFCLYATVAILFVYVYQLTFFAGIMVLTSRRELEGRHCLTFAKVTNKVHEQSKNIAAGSKDKLKRFDHERSTGNVWSAVYSKPAYTNATEISAHHSNHALANFFRTVYASLLLNPAVRFFVICLFLIYIGLAIWGCTGIQLGLEPMDLLPADSYGRKGSSINYVTPVTNGMKLEACRFPVHLRYVGMQNQSRAMSSFRRLAEGSQLDVQVYSDFFRFAEQYDAVLPATLVNIGLAGGAVILVRDLLLIPQPLTALWVSLAIVSINTGILGYMSFWAVRLDFVSMVTIVMSIGFCVDFSAHLAYHFAKERGRSAPDRLRLALYAVGTPILQSAASTVLGVLFLLAVESYVFRSFLKTVILVIVLGAGHGLVVLPVLFTLFFCQPLGEQQGTIFKLPDTGSQVGGHVSGRKASNLMTCPQDEEEYASGSGSGTGSNGRPSYPGQNLHPPPHRDYNNPASSGCAPFGPQKYWCRPAECDLPGASSSVSKTVSVGYSSPTLPYLLQMDHNGDTYNGRPTVFTPEQLNGYFVVTDYDTNNDNFLTVQNLPFADPRQSFHSLE